MHARLQIKCMYSTSASGWGRSRCRESSMLRGRRRWHVTWLQSRAPWATPWSAGWRHSSPPHSLDQRADLPTTPHSRKHEPGQRVDSLNTINIIINQCIINLFKLILKIIYYRGSRRWETLPSYAQDRSHRCRAQSLASQRHYEET